MFGVLSLEILLIGILVLNFETHVLSPSIFLNVYFLSLILFILFLPVALSFLIAARSTLAILFVGGFSSTGIL